MNIKTEKEAMKLMSYWFRIKNKRNGQRTRFVMILDDGVFTNEHQRYYAA